MERVNNAGLPGLRFCDDSSVGKVDSDGDLAQGMDPGEFAGLLEAFKPSGVAGLQGSYFEGDGKGFGVKRGPEEM